MYSKSRQNYSPLQKMQQAKKINDEINFGCMWEAIDYKLPVEIAIVNPIY